MNHNDKSVDVYERLANALDALPSGFTRTPSKLEIELIKIVFTHEEASLAGQLTRTPDTAAEIAQRVGLDEEKVTVLLESMIPRRMVRADHAGPRKPALKDWEKWRQNPPSNPRQRA